MFFFAEHRAFYAECCRKIMLVYAKNPASSIRHKILDVAASRLLSLYGICTQVCWSGQG